MLHLAAVASESAAPEGPIEIGFVVNKAVGPAVTRNLVKRRLRHIARERMTSLPGSASLVVRALPASASASYASLLADFDASMLRLTHRDTAHHREAHETNGLRA